MRLRALLVGCVTWSCFSEGSSNSTGDSDPTTGAEGTDASASTTLGESSSSASTTDPSTSNATTGPDMTTTPDTGEVDSDTDECPGDSVIPPPPPGPEWDGPFMLVPGDMGCPMPLQPMMPSPIFAMPDMVTECECTCAGTCGLNVASPGDSECSTVLTSSVADETCQAVVAGAYVLPSGSAGQGNACETPTVVTPSVGFGETHRVCAGMDAPCFPVNEGSIGPCFRIPGHSESCAATGLPVQIRVMTNADVLCEPCEQCITALDAACLAATVTGHATDNCDGAGAPISIDDCTLVEGMGVQIDFDLACPRAESQLMPVDAATFCCAEPG